MRWFLALWLLTAPAMADEALDCKDPQDQNSMTRCAGLDYEKADKELNAFWHKFKAETEDSDKDTGKHEYTDALLASQRAWISFRDVECIRQGFEAHGGSLEPMIVNGCSARLTRERIKQLQSGASE